VATVMFALTIATMTAQAAPPTLVDHPIASGIAPTYLDGGGWTATRIPTSIVSAVRLGETTSTAYTPFYQVVPANRCVLPFNCHVVCTWCPLVLS
jgi:hypothetical protein